DRGCHCCRGRGCHGCGGRRCHCCRGRRCHCCRGRRRDAWCHCRRGCWRRRRSSAGLQRVALRASSRSTGAVAEVLVKGDVVFLHTGGCRRVAVVHYVVDHIEARLVLVQT